MDLIGLSVLKRATELEQMGEVLIIGEQLRLRLHEEKVIKDRRHHLKTYPNCFVAKELIDWLLDRKEATERPIAIELMQKMIDNNIIHHVCDEFKDFRDAKLFYRFRKDDGTFPLDQEVKVFMRGQRLYEKIMNSDNTLLQAQEEDGVKHERCFVASAFVDWLIQEQEAKSRSEAEQLCRRLLEHAIIQHVSSKHHFVDSSLLYQFRLNFRRRRRVMELLIKRPQTVVESQDSPFCLRKQSHDKSTSFLSVSPSNEVKVVSVRRSSMSSSSSSGYFSSSPTLSSSPPVVLCNPKSVLKRQITLDELFVPGAPYARKTLTIVSDAVGWGFVVRGSKPCHIQAVDPSGPAAAAGMKGNSLQPKNTLRDYFQKTVATSTSLVPLESLRSRKFPDGGLLPPRDCLQHIIELEATGELRILEICQFVVSVNGLNVLHCDFRAVSSLILTGPRTIVMEVMEDVSP